MARKKVEKVAEKKARRAAVRADVFVAEYKAALTNGLTTAELAVKLGMPAIQVSMRASQLRKRLKEQHGKDLPKLKRTTPSREVTEGALADLADFLSPNSESGS